MPPRSTFEIRKISSMMSIVSPVSSNSFFETFQILYLRLNIILHLSKLLVRFSSGYIFINTDFAEIDDDIVRRDSLHAIINSLPDPNYATLRAITLHLNRVTENAAANRMNASNLAIVFGPTLMGANTGSNIQDAGWQVRVIDTILNNTYQIFDDD
jgi:hypothetical protein